MMVKYSDEKKQEALQMIKEKGVKATHENMNISMQTLYKWRNGDAEAPTPKAKKAKIPNDEMAKLINESEYLEAKVSSLEEEIKALREKNAALRKALAMFID